MKNYITILLLAVFCGQWPQVSSAQTAEQKMTLDFFGENLSIAWNPEMDVPYTGPISYQGIQQFYQTLSATSYQPLVESLKSLRETRKLDDWLFFQLVRKTTQIFSPKQENYTRYTLFKMVFICGVSLMVY